MTEERLPYFARMMFGERMPGNLDERRQKLAEMLGHTADDAPMAAGKYVCLACKNAPRRYADFPNTWQWKTERGWREHKCLGVKEAA